MADENKVKAGAPVDTQGARRATGGATGGAGGPLAPGQRWSASKKRDVVMRLLRGETAESLSRELGVEAYRLEEWRERVVNGMEASLRERESYSGQEELGAALKRVGELTMENELLKLRIDRPGPLLKRRSGR